MFLNVTIRDEHLLVLVKEMVGKTSRFVGRRETDCIRCGKCVEVCPTGLYPLFIKEAIDKGNLERAKRLCIMDCITGVLCTNACPSGIQLLDLFREAKRQIVANPQRPDNVEQRDPDHKVVSELYALNAC